MDMPISTEYPKLQVADPTRPSLADLPLEIVLEILEALFKPAQLIAIDIFGPEHKYLDDSDVEDCKVILRAPPLNTTAAAACRLFRRMYRKSRPTLWGAHLHLGRSYHVGLARDIFHVRVHRGEHYPEWVEDGRPHLERLDGILNGIQKLATSPNCVFEAKGGKGLLLMLLLNPAGKELNILVPVSGLERNVDAAACGELELTPVLLPLRAQDKIVGSVYQGLVAWWEFKTGLEEFLRLRAQVFVTSSAEQRREWGRTWMLCPTPELRGYLVDERRLNDPNAFGIWSQFRLAGGPGEDFARLRAGR